MNAFINPDPIYKGTDFFMLNGKLSEEELIRQLREMHSKGVRSVIARTYIGLKSDYPGPDFMAKTSALLLEASKLGMTIFLQAGYMPEAVLDLPESASLDYLCVEKREDFPDGCTKLQKHGGYVYYSRSSKTVLDLFDENACAFYIRQSYDLWQPFKEYFGNTVLSVWVDEPSYHSEHLPWFSSFPDIFAKTYGYDIREHIYKLFFDTEDYRKVRYHYWTLLEKLLEKCYFSMIRDWCRDNGLMFSGHLMHEDSLCSTISRACATMPYYKYFDIPGIDILTGDMDFPENPIKQPDHSKFDYFGYTTPMQCVSAAHQAGKEHILCEMYGVTSNGMSFRDFLHHFDHYASLGINHRSVHGIFYSLHGRSKRQYPPHVNYYQPYWEKYSDVTDYVARTSAFLSQGKPEAKVLVIYPLETAYCHYRGGDGNAVPTEELRTLDLAYNTLVRDLLAQHISYELGDLLTISSGYGKVCAKDKKFAVGEMEYDTVVLPYLEVLDAVSASLIKEFSEIGGKVIVLGKYPDMIDGEPFDVKEKYLKGAVFAENIQKLSGLLADDAAFYKIFSNQSSSHIRVYRTRRGKEQYFMLFNTNCRCDEKIVLTLPGNHTAERFFAESGKLITFPTSFDGNETVVCADIAKGASVLLRFTVSEDGIRSVQASAKPEYRLTLPDSAKIRRHDKNVLLLEFGEYKTENDADFIGPYTSLTVNRLLTDAEYCGELIQRYRFFSRKAFAGLSLALEDAAECEVYLNGKKADAYDGREYYFSKDFQAVKLPDACVVGENVIEIKRVFKPLSKAKSSITSLFECQTGTEIESMYLLGDFGTYSVSEPCFNGSLRYGKDVYLDEEKDTVTGELTQNGYIFYTGKMSVVKYFTVEKTAGNISLCVSEFCGSTAEVFVNGISCGDLIRYPYTVDITKAVRSGENTVEIILYNTLRPILGPYHRPQGEIGECWGGGYGDPDSAWTGSFEGGSDWYKNTTVDSGCWQNSYNQQKLGVLGVTLIMQ